MQRPRPVHLHNKSPIRFLVRRHRQRPLISRPPHPTRRGRKKERGSGTGKSPPESRPSLRKGIASLLAQVSDPALSRDRQDSAPGRLSWGAHRATAEILAHRKILLTKPYGRFLLGSELDEINNRANRLRRGQIANASVQMQSKLACQNVV